ncbi:unnamed protein product [Prorocentrum cordatum]|uniref:Enhancer of rudimentary homolog n=1 Tax=Prorocentrum cordatum TaxID=2364126 RepID=A0ABN9QWH2_9DINO|nr:unnamed protein product [Polarella glacialis]
MYGQPDDRLPNGHTILLVQFRKVASSRTYLEYDSLSEGMDGLCQLYEQALKMQHADKATAKYSLEELWQFVDDLQDIVCLIHDARGGDYLPHGRAWIKKQVLNHLKGQLPALP